MKNTYKSPKIWTEDWSRDIFLTSTPVSNMDGTTINDGEGVFDDFFGQN